MDFAEYISQGRKRERWSLHIKAHGRKKSLISAGAMGAVFMLSRKRRIF